MLSDDSLQKYLGKSINLCETVLYVSADEKCKALLYVQIFFTDGDVIFFAKKGFGDLVCNKYNWRSDYSGMSEESKEYFSSERQLVVNIMFSSLEEGCSVRKIEETRNFFAEGEYESLFLEITGFKIVLMAESDELSLIINNKLFEY